VETPVPGVPFFPPDFAISLPETPAILPPFLNVNFVKFTSN